MATFQIWYMRPEWFRDGICYRKPNPHNLDKTHIHLKDIDAEGTHAEQLEGIFRDMQGEVWSPHGEARALIEAKGLQHTSMSVGDVIVNTKDGAVYLVVTFGFNWLNPEDYQPPTRGHSLAKLES